MLTSTCMYEKIKFVDVPTIFGFDRLPDIYVSHGTYFTTILIYLSIEFFDKHSMDRDNIDKILSKFAFVYEGKNETWGSDKLFRLVAKKKIILCEEVDANNLGHMKVYHIV